MRHRQMIQHFLQKRRHRFRANMDFFDGVKLMRFQPMMIFQWMIVIRDDGKQFHTVSQ